MLIWQVTGENPQGVNPRQGLVMCVQPHTVVVGWIPPALVCWMLVLQVQPVPAGSAGPFSGMEIVRSFDLKCAMIFVFK